MRKCLPALAGILLPLLVGCSGMDTLSLVQDRPEDIDQLLQQHEYARVRQLTGRYPSLDTPAVRDAVAQQEAGYVDSTLAAARTLESGQDLLGAVQLLSGALQRVPHSEPLRELRNALEQERLRQLRHNEREQLVSRAAYMLDQQQLYQQQVNLQEPSLVQRLESARNEKLGIDLSRQLVEHGAYSLQQAELENAQVCLDLSMALHASPEARSLLEEVAAARHSRNQQAQQDASVLQTRNQQKHSKKQQQKTEVLLAETQQALENNDLQLARNAFVQIPSSASNHHVVRAVQDDLDRKLNTQVATLMATGDAQYRADKVIEAISTWEKAHALDPGNPALKQRLERARKVLARLEELKSAQRK